MSKAFVAMRLSVENEKALQDRLRGLSNAARKKALAPAVSAAGKVLLAEAKRQVPRASGLLARSLTIQVRKFRRVVECKVGQRKQRRTFKASGDRRKRLSQITRSGMAAPIHFVERPIKAHTIKPKNGKLLVFPVVKSFTKKGRARMGVAVAKQVKHPGTNGKYILARAAISKRSQAYNAFAEVVRANLK